MDLLISRVVVLEENRTRAELYALWLDDYDVSVALTTREADEQFDSGVGVAVLDQEFGDDSGALLDAIRERAPVCRVAATRDRSAAFPDLGVDHQLVKPVFEDDLRELTERLLWQANYHLALCLYYRATVELSSLDVAADEPDPGDGHYEELRRRASMLGTLVSELRNRLSAEDITAVRHSIVLESDIETADEREKIDSKYRPDECSHCGQDWSTSDADAERTVTQLGAYVWRCARCGYVQMHSDPSHRKIGSYRK